MNVNICGIFFYWLSSFGSIGSQNSILSINLEMLVVSKALHHNEMTSHGNVQTKLKNYKYTRPADVLQYPHGPTSIH